MHNVYIEIKVCIILKFFYKFVILIIKLLYFSIFGIIYRIAKFLHNILLSIA